MHIAREGECPEADKLGREAATAESNNQPTQALALLDRARSRRLSVRHYDRAFTSSEWKTHQRAHARGEYDIVEVRRGKAYGPDDDDMWLIVGAAGKDVEGKLLVVWEFNDEECARAIATTINAMVVADVMHAIAQEESAAA